MKFLRKRVFAILLLVLFLQSLIAPQVAHALTSGPQQPELASYEEPGSPDMVNLLTGDFNTSLPVLQVPGPEGGFSLPLFYHGGIRPDQEATWVGLGWNMNPGSVTRNISGYPDDASGETNAITVKDLEGIYGIEINSYIIGRAGINNVQGNYGSLSFLSLVDVDYSNGGVTNVGVLGVNVSDDGNVSFNTVQFVGALFTICSFGATGAAASEAASLAGKTAAEASQAATEAMVKQLAQNIATGVAVGGITGGGSAGPAASTDGYWHYQKSQKRHGLFAKSYHIWLDQTRYEQMYGTLYSHKRRA